MASPTGLIGGPVLNGEVLEGALSSLEMRARDVGRRVVETATGDLRQGLHYLGADRELVKRKYDHILRYNHQAAALYDLVEELLAGPGPHALVSWKAVPLQLMGNGSRKEWSLPRTVANHFYSPPNHTGSWPAERFAPAVRVGATVLEVSAQDEATFESGYPPSGEAWLLEQGQALRLSAAPAAGAIVYVRYCPVFSCFAADQFSKSYQGNAPLREPRDIELRER